MFAYDKTFDPEVVLGQYDLIISRHSIGIWTYCFQDMYEYDKTFDRKVFLGHCDLISWFSDFALYLDTQLVFFHTSF